MDIRKQLIILILVLLCAPVSAQKKEKLITLKFTNIPLSEAMPKVEKQSGYTFFYESQQIDIKQKVSLNVKNETINKTIAALLKGTNVKFEIDANEIVNSFSSLKVYFIGWMRAMMRSISSSGSLRNVNV